MSARTYSNVAREHAFALMVPSSSRRFGMCSDVRDDLESAWNKADGATSKSAQQEAASDVYNVAQRQGLSRYSQGAAFWLLAAIQGGSDEKLRNAWKVMHRCK